MRLQNLYRSPPRKSRLVWALPLGILICALMWYFEARLYAYGGFYRLSRSEIDSFYATTVPNYIASGVVGSIPILVANWSRTLWPRLAVALALVAVQLITGSIFILAPRGA
jgi:hypothetical protein